MSVSTTPDFSHLPPPTTLQSSTASQQPSEYHYTYTNTTTKNINKVDNNNTTRPVSENFPAYPLDLSMEKKNEQGSLVYNSQSVNEHQNILRSTCIDMNFDRSNHSSSSPSPSSSAPSPIIASDFDTPKTHHHLQHEKHVDKQSLDYVIRSSIAGGLAGTSAKTLIAPLDRVKILFQTSNPEFKRFAGSWLGFYRAAQEIYRTQGFLGLFQGHSATLIRIFPYAATKFVVYEQVRALLIPSKDKETSTRRFMAGSVSGVASVFVTYPLDLVRVRLAFQTKVEEPIGTGDGSAIHPAFKKHGRHYDYKGGRFVQTVAQIFNEPPVTNKLFSSFSSSSPSATAASGSSSSRLLSSTLNPPAAVRNAYNWVFGLTNFYRGFLPTIIGMVPYAGVSFWAHDLFHDMFRSSYLAPYAVMKPEQLLENNEDDENFNDSIDNKDGSFNKTYNNHRVPLTNWAQLTAGGLAGMLAQTASYPLEVVRRRIQVSGVTGESVGILQTARAIYNTSLESERSKVSGGSRRLTGLNGLKGFRGFFVGLSIGYIKVVPMFACSFFVYERMKSLLGI